MTHLILRYTLTGCLFIAAASTTTTTRAQADGTGDKAQPHIAYPGWSRPSSEGKRYDTWKDAKGPDIGAIQVDRGRLPARVDNSDRPQFPPIYRQTYGACGQFAAVASVFTYEMNILDGTVADSNATRFPAHFSWNMMNRAGNNGSEAYHGWEVAKRIGIPTAEAYGGVRHDTIGLWPSGYDTWHNAMHHRIAGYRYTPALTVAQLDEARGWLYDRNQPAAKGDRIGGVFQIDGRMGQGKDRDEVTVKIAKGEYAEGQGLWTAWSKTGFGHGMACVGYDDQVGYDRNGDGEITNDKDITGDGKVTLADWERGAWIVVNSWGEKWSDDGKIYLLYSAMTDETWPRGQYMGRVEVTRHQPRITAKLKLAFDNRTDLRVTIGVASDPNAKVPKHTFEPQALNGWPLFGGFNPGSVPIAGPDNPEPIEVGIDLTELFNRIDAADQDSARFFFRLTRKDGSNATGQLHEAAIRFYGGNGEFLREVPMQISEGKFGQTPIDLSTVITADKQDKQEERLSLASDGKTVLTYHAAHVPSPIADAPWYGRSGFIHPVMTPKGSVVTDAFPQGHPHQHGLMFAWTSAEYDGKPVDFWNSQKKQARIEHVETLHAGDDRIEVKLKHVITADRDQPLTVLHETWTLTRVPHDTMNVFDLVSVQTNITDKPLIIRQYKYGGMCIRGTADWATQYNMLTSEGLDTIKGNHTRPSWVAMFGSINNAPAGIAAMSHPDNDQSPQPVRLHPEKPYFCFAPMVAGTFEITADEPYTARYRFAAFDGKPDAKQLNALWQDYKKRVEK